METKKVKFNDTKATRFYKLDLNAFYPVVRDWEWTHKVEGRYVPIKYVTIKIQGVETMFSQRHIAETKIS